MRLFKFLLTFTFALAGAQAAEYDIDEAHSFVQFRTQHLGISWLIGRFNDITGEFSYDPQAAASEQSIRVVIQTDSVDSNHAERDKHLRGDDFLDVKKYPTATFESSGYVGDENGGIMRGMFTLHGVSHPVEIPITKIGEGADPWGGYRAGFQGTLSIMRADFGIDFNLGPTAEKVDLDIYLEGIRR